MRQVSLSLFSNDEIEALRRYTAAQLAMIELGPQCNFVMTLGFSLLSYT